MPVGEHVDGGDLLRDALRGVKPKGVKRPDEVSMQPASGTARTP
jgi:hypothetical protein